MRGMGVAACKFPGVAARVAERPAVCIDDDPTDAEHDPAEMSSDAGLATLFLQPRADVGLERWHVERVLAFLRRHAPPGG
jgi:hypothetical protein